LWCGILAVDARCGILAVDARARYLCFWIWTCSLSARIRQRIGTRFSGGRGRCSNYQQISNYQGLIARKFMEEASQEFINVQFRFSARKCVYHLAGLFTPPLPHYASSRNHCYHQKSSLHQFSSLILIQFVPDPSIPLIPHWLLTDRLFHSCRAFHSSCAARDRPLLPYSSLLSIYSTLLYSTCVVAPSSSHGLPVQHRRIASLPFQPSLHQASHLRIRLHSASLSQLIFPSSSSGSPQRLSELYNSQLLFISDIYIYMYIFRSSTRIYVSTHLPLNTSFSRILDICPRASSIPAKFPPCSDSLLVTNRLWVFVVVICRAASPTVLSPQVFDFILISSVLLCYLLSPYFLSLSPLSAILYFSSFGNILRYYSPLGYFSLPDFLTNLRLLSATSSTIFSTSTPVLPSSCLPPPLLPSSCLPRPS